MSLPRARTINAIAALLVLSGCSAGPAAEPPAAPAPATVPPDWVAVASDAGDLRLTLPPWLVPFDSTGAIFANEVVPDGGQGLQLMAEAPATVDPPPDRASVASWLRTRVESPGAGLGEVGTVRLPTGDAVVLRRVDRAGTPLAWRLAAYAIDTPAGIAYLLVDGPPAAWEGRDDDVARIAELVQVRRAPTP